MIERFDIAGYARISVDDEQDQKNISIENQKAIIEDYVKTHFPGSTLTFFEDRDRSGYTFEQREGYQEMRRGLKPGAVVVGKVVRMEPFGAFVDIGRGIVALLPTEYISAARIRHPNERFRVGQKILAVVKVFDRENRRITLTHKELLGTWLENASRFSEGDTVRGTVRGVMDYGCFVELAPNLSGLTDQREDLREGDGVSVTIRSIRPERMKIKLQVIETLPPTEPPETLPYWITDGVLDRWVYSPANCERPPVVTEFTEIP